MSPHTQITTARKPPSTNPYTKQRTESKIPRPKHYTAFFKPRSAKENDRYSTSSEEEIVSELDETALSKLPLHLQNNMRELQAERVNRLRIERRQRRPRYLHRRRESIFASMGSLKSSKRVEGKDSSAFYAERWFQKTLAKVAATRELEVNKVMEGYEDGDNTRHENSTWCPVRHEWVPVYYGQGQRNEQRHTHTHAHGHGQKQAERTPPETTGGRSRAGSRASRLCGIGLGDREETPLSQADTVVAERYYLTSRHDCRISSHSRYMSWRCAGPYYVHEARAGEDCCLREGRREGLSRFMSVMSCRIQSKLREAKMLFKN